MPPPDRSYRFARRPKWIVGHLLALAGIIGFVNLGLWQLRRHDERAASNAVMAARIAEPARPLADVVAEFGDDPAVLEFRRISATGTYEVRDEVLWQARTRNGQSGHDVLTPLLVDGMALIVDRGWVPIDASGPPVAEAAPPPGSVTVVGMIRPGGHRGGLGPTDPATGVLDRISRVDLERLQQQIALPLFSFYLLLEEQSPPQAGALPAPQPPPELDAGPHLSYAFQWFAFAVIAAVGYPVLLRRTARDPAQQPQAGRRA